MNKFLIVLSHTFITTAKSKTFKITTTLTALLIIAIFSMPTILSYFDDEEKLTKIGIVDLTNETTILLEEQLKYLNYNGIKLETYIDEEKAGEDLEKGTISGYLVIQYLSEGTIKVIYKAPQITNSSTINKLEQGLNQTQFRLKAETLGLTLEQAGQLFQPVLVEKIPLDENAKSEEEVIQSQILVYILLFAIYFGVLMYGNVVANEIAKEKSSRIMEILISSLNPITQMFGKVLGIAILGLTQASFFVAVGYVTLKLGDKKINFGGLSLDFSNLPNTTIISAIIFFILGYLLYAFIAAMLGSLVSRVEDLQQAMTPVTLIVLAGFMIAMFGLSNPDSTFIVILSFIPLFTPMIMFLRVGTSNPAIWEVLLSIGLMIITILIVAVLAAKVYRGGVLMYGKGASFKSIRKALTINREN